MATTELTNAVAAPLDDGVGSVGDTEESSNSAGYIAASGAAQRGNYREVGSFELTNVDATNDTVDITSGRAYVEVSGVDVQSDRTDQDDPPYDATLATPVPVMIDLDADETGFSVQDGVNDLYLVLDTDGATTGTAGNVYVEYGTAISTPSKPYVYLGQADASGSGPSATTRGGRDGVYDTGGRFLGRLTGSNDAQVVIDAISDRIDGTSLIIPDPGFYLDWEQEVDLPAFESGFGIYTIGVPRLTFPGSFSGSQAFHKPAPGSNVDNDELTEYYIGNFYFDDASNGVLSYAIRADDLKGSVIDKSFYHKCPGIRIDTTDNFSTDNRILGGKCDHGTGPAVDLYDANTTRVYQFNFTDNTNQSSSTATVIHDRGNHNSFLASRAEWAGTIHIEDGANNYFIDAQDWDRDSEYNNSIVEKNGASGTVRFTGNNKQQLWGKAQIQSPNTRVTQAGMNSAMESRGIVDYFDHFKKITNEDAFPSGVAAIGENNSGGSTSTFFNAAGGAPVITLNATQTAANYALLQTGNGANAMVDSSVRPLKFGAGFLVGAPAANALIQIGLADQTGSQTPNTSAEFVYDSENTLGGHTNSNWYFEVRTGGTLRGSTDTGVDATTTTDWMAINHNPHAGEFYGSVDAGTWDTIGNGGTAATDLNWRWRVQNIGGSGSDVTQDLNLRKGLFLSTF